MPTWSLIIFQQLWITTSHKHINLYFFHRKLTCIKLILFFLVLLILVYLEVPIFKQINTSWTTPTSTKNVVQLTHNGVIVVNFKYLRLSWIHTRLGKRLISNAALTSEYQQQPIARHSGNNKETLWKQMTPLRIVFFYLLRIFFTAKRFCTRRII